MTVLVGSDSLWELHFRHTKNMEKLLTYKLACTIVHRYFLYALKTCFYIVQVNSYHSEIYIHWLINIFPCYIIWIKNLLASLIVLSNLSPSFIDWFMKHIAIATLIDFFNILAILIHSSIPLLFRFIYLLSCYYPLTLSWKIIV